MQPTEHVEFDLPKNLVASMNEAVEAGKYHTASEVVRAALIQWWAHENAPLAHADELRSLCDEGDASGDARPFTLEDLLAEIHKPTI